MWPLVSRAIPELSIVIFFLFLGIPVAELSLNDPYNIESYLNNTKGIGPNNLTDLTVCLRFNVNYLKPMVSTILSYSTFYSDNSLVAELSITPNERLQLCFAYAFGPITYHCVEILQETHNLKIHNEWHHTCFSLKNEELDSETIQIISKVYYDGTEVTWGKQYCFMNFLV